MMDYDIIIVGGGLVGAGFALAMKQSGLRIALLNSAPLPAKQNEGNWDSRIYAISPGNLAFLERYGLALDRERIMPVSQMRIMGDDGVSALNFSAYQAAQPALAYILENNLLHDTLWTYLKDQAWLELIPNCRPTKIEWGKERVSLNLDNGAELTTRLLIGADGAHSWVRQQMAIAAEPNQYNQKGVVANFECEKLHHGIAHQWFRQDGILAWLPLPGKRVSMVWSIENEAADKLLMLPRDEFCRQVQLAGQSCLGALRLISTPNAFPLQLMKLETIIKPRAVLIGDAAHTVHPLAGQGVNLGLQDARKLADILIGRKSGVDIGEYQLLRQYERARKEQVMAMQLVTDGLQKLFNNRVTILADLRNKGLTVTDRLPYLKRMLIQHALA